MAVLFALAGRRLSVPALITGLAVLLGGGGSPAVITETAAELATLTLLAIVALRGSGQARSRRNDPAWTMLVIAICSFPLIQLVPMPPSLWRLLPGRSDIVGPLTAVGQRDGWLSWSLLPDAAVTAALSLIPALALALLTAQASAAGRTRLIWVLAIAGAAASLLGLLQFIAGPDRVISLYAEVHRGWAIGFFANRNAQADLVAITLLATVLLAERYRDRLATGVGRYGVVGAMLLLLLAGVATGSRMGLAILAIPLLSGFWQTRRRTPVLAAGLAVGAAVLLIGGTALDRVTARAHDAGNRVEIWGDALLVARSVAPIGAGMGSFVPLYAAAERLEHVQPTIANRAHNDYLELAIEGGLPALTLLAAVLAFVARRSWANWRSDDADRRLHARFAALTTTILAVHSTVDYPLRNLTLMTVAGLALGLLAKPAMTRAKDMRSGHGGQVYA